MQQNRSSQNASRETRHVESDMGKDLLPFFCRNTQKNVYIFIFLQEIRVITKLPNSEQSYKGKVKTHNYINRQNQSTSGKL
jgi:hypothetical protein